VKDRSGSCAPTPQVGVPSRLPAKALQMTLVAVFSTCAIAGMAVKTVPSTIAAAIDRRLTKPLKFVGQSHFTGSLHMKGDSMKVRRNLEDTTSVI
jgi:hypothetical protein